ncbi:MAG TPA: hypothetical protein VEV43_10825 [Actinomycetota bacterium]|nr:hypothetical protein [Actinomycetota bacterium]
MRKSLSLLVAAAAVAGSIATAAPAHAWTCAINDEYVPEEVGDAACFVVLTVAGTVCKVAKPACFA